MLKTSCCLLKATLTRVHDGSVVGSFVSLPSGPVYTRFMQDMLGVAKARFLWVYTHKTDYKGEPVSQIKIPVFGAMDPSMSGDGTSEGALASSGRYIERVLDKLHSGAALFVTPRYGDPRSLMKLTVEEVPAQRLTPGEAEGSDETIGAPATADTPPIRMEF